MASIFFGTFLEKMKICEKKLFLGILKEILSFFEMKIIKLTTSRPRHVLGHHL
jgi:hypothetical protein